MVGVWGGGLQLCECTRVGQLHLLVSLCCSYSYFEKVVVTCQNGSIKAFIVKRSMEGLDGGLTVELPQPWRPPSLTPPPPSLFPSLLPVLCCKIFQWDVAAIRSRRVLPIPSDSHPSPLSPSFFPQIPPFLPAIEQWKEAGILGGGWWGGGGPCDRAEV